MQIALSSAKESIMNKINWLYETKVVAVIFKKSCLLWNTEVSSLDELKYQQYQRNWNVLKVKLTFGIFSWAWSKAVEDNTKNSWNWSKYFQHFHIWWNSIELLTLFLQFHWMAVVRSHTSAWNFSGPDFTNNTKVQKFPQTQDRKGWVSCYFSSVELGNTTHPRFEMLGANQDIRFCGMEKKKNEKVIPRHYGRWAAPITIIQTNITYYILVFVSFV